MVDELVYKAAAESFFRFGDFDKLYLGYRPILGNFLYPSVISLSFYFGSNFYFISKAINAALISIAIVPTYFIAKYFSRGKWPLLPVILVIFMPSNLYANYIMTESLFFPLFLFTFLFIFMAIYYNKVKDEIAAGLSIALLFLTKPHAFGLIVALILLVIVLIVFSKYLSVSTYSIVRPFSITICIALISYVGILLLVRHRIHVSDIFGMYSYYGWGLVTKPIAMVESARDMPSSIRWLRRSSFARP